MIDEELEKQYSPKQWSPRFPPHLVVQKHCEVAEKGSAAAKATVPCQLGVQYGPSEGQRLDLFGGDALPKDAPIVVFLHGGYWQALSRDISSYFVPPMYQAGARGAVIGYDLTPKVTLTEIVEQINKGVKYLLDFAHQNGSKALLFSGHCAGATLIFTMLTSKWFRDLPKSDQQLFKGVLFISGVYDLAPLIYTTKNDALKLTQKEIAEYSPINIIDLLPANVKESCKFIICKAEYDSREFSKQSETFKNKLQETCKNIDYFTVPEVDHFNIAEHLVDSNFILVQKVIQLFK